MSSLTLPSKGLKVGAVLRLTNSNVTVSSHVDLAEDLFLINQTNSNVQLIKQVRIMNTNQLRLSSKQNKIVILCDKLSQTKSQPSFTNCPEYRKYKRVIRTTEK